jgi:hypothetical protein
MIGIIRRLRIRVSLLFAAPFLSLLALTQLGFYIAALASEANSQGKQQRRT